MVMMVMIVMKMNNKINTKMKRIVPFILLLGGFAVTFGCFSLPSYLHWKLVPGLSTCQKVLDWILVVIGLILMVVTTVITIVL